MTSGQLVPIKKEVNKKQVKVKEEVTEDGVVVILSSEDRRKANQRRYEKNRANKARTRPLGLV